MKLLHCCCLILVLALACHLCLVVGITFSVQGSQTYSEVNNHIIFLYAKLPDDTVYRDEYVKIDIKRVFEVGPNQLPLSAGEEVRNTVPGTTYELVDHATTTGYEMINSGGYQRNASVHRFAFPNGASLELHFNAFDSNRNLSFPLVNESIPVKKGTFKIEFVWKDWPFARNCTYFNCCSSPDCYPPLSVGSCGVVWDTADIFHLNHALVMDLRVVFNTFIDKKERPVPVFGTRTPGEQWGVFFFIGKYIKGIMRVLRWGIRDVFQRFRIFSAHDLNGKNDVEVFLELAKTVENLTPAELQGTFGVGLPFYVMIPCFDGQFFWDPDLTALFTGPVPEPASAALVPPESSAPKTVIIIVVVIVVLVIAGVLVLIPSIRRRIFPYSYQKRAITATSAPIDDSQGTADGSQDSRVCKRTTLTIDI